MVAYGNLDEVVEVLNDIRDRGVKCNLLIGAGCSYSAGIPTADGFIEEIKNKFPARYKSVQDKSYASCMNRLAIGERKGLIKKFVDSAKVNMAHLAIAELIKNGYIHRVLTPNFDNLLIKACGFVNEYLPVYDLATQDSFRPEHIPDKSIFYLHGQYTGLKLMNTKLEVEEQANKLKPLFKRINENSLWIIIGYSGKNDALLKLLQNENTFENSLFWIGFRDNEPESEMKDFFKEEKYSFYVKDYDADSFLYELAMRLNIFPPSLLLKPFSHLREMVETIVPYEQKSYDQLSTTIINEIASDVLEKAINSYENNADFMAEYYLKYNLFDKIIELKDNLSKNNKGVLEKAYFRKAYQAHIFAKKNSSTEEFYESIELYEACLLLNPKDKNAFNNIGATFRGIALIETNSEIELTYKAIESYSKALELDSKFLLSISNSIGCINAILTKAKKNDKLTQIINQGNSLNKDAENYIFEFANWLSQIVDLIQKKIIDSSIDTDKLMQYTSKLIIIFESSTNDKNSMNEAI